MARPVRDERDQFVARTSGGRLEPIEQLADRLHNSEIGALIATADVVSFANPAALNHVRERLSVILNVEPIAYVLTVAINRQRFVGEAPDDHVRDQLFREMIGAIIVGAIGNDGRQPIGLAPGAYQVIRRGL